MSDDDQAETRQMKMMVRDLQRRVSELESNWMRRIEHRVLSDTASWCAVIERVEVLESKLRQLSWRVPHE